MTKYSKVTAGSPLRFSAGLYNDLVDLVQVPVGNVAGDRLAASMRVLVTIKNTTEDDRWRFDCMSLGATRFTIGADGKESVIFDAEEADPAKPPAILQVPIPAGRYGQACIFGYTLAKLKQASSASDLLGTPDATDHNLEPGSTGPIKILAAPSTSEASLRPVLIGGGTGGGRESLLIKTPSGGIAAATGSGPYTWGSATCTIVDDDGEVGSDTIVVKNIVNQSIAGNVVGKADPVGSIWVIDVASCGS